MSVGRIARRLLGPRYFSLVGRAYRRIFVDLTLVARAIGHLDRGTLVLDVGGGDGELVNLLLACNPGVRFTMLDVSADVGGGVLPEYRERVTIMPCTRMVDYSGRGLPIPDVVLISDVVHHVPPGQRLAFFGELRVLLDGHECSMFVKDVQPGYFRSSLGYLADRWVSGDRQVSLVSREEIADVVREVFPDARCSETDLFSTDRPNYCLSFILNQDAGERSVPEP